MYNNGLIMMLVANDASLMGQHMTYAAELGVVECMTNIDYDVPRSCDTLIIEAIRIPVEYHMNMFDSFELNIGENKFEIDFKLLLDLSEIRKTKMYYIIDIPWSLFTHDKKFSEILLISLQYHRISFRLNGKHDLNYNIITKNKYYQTKERKIIATGMFNIFMNELTRVPFDYKKIDCDDYYIRGRCYGMFIRTDKIDYIKVSIGDYELFHYDNEMLKYMGSKIKKCGWSSGHSRALYDSLCNFLPNEMIDMIEQYARYKETLYWIPFDPRVRWDSSDNSAIKLQNIKISFNRNQSGIIYFATVDEFIIASGIMARRYFT